MREIRKNPQLGMQPVGFLDDSLVKLGKRIYEVPVLGTLADLEALVETHRVDQVVVAMPTAPGATVRALLDACHRAGVEARSVPGMFELLEGGVSVSRLREIDITDLLRRQPIQASPEAGLYLQGKTVLVTGAGGSIGGELCRQLARAQVAELVLARPRREQHLRRLEPAAPGAPRRGDPPGDRRRPRRGAHRRGVRRLHARRSSSTPRRTSTCR